LTRHDRPLPRLVLLLSGAGSNLQAIIDAIEAGQLPARVVAVISNRADAAGLQRAARHGIPSQVISHRDHPDRASFDAALASAIDHYQPDWVLLAGFMRILTPQFVDHFRDRLLNIHPSLLPAYPGLDTHRRVLAAGEREHGATLHLVTEALDAGPTVLQGRFAVEADDDAATLAQKVHRLEHQIYPAALALLVSGQLRIDQGRLFYLDQPVPAEGLQWDQVLGSVTPRCP